MASRLAQVHPIRAERFARVLAPSSRVKIRRMPPPSLPPETFFPGWTLGRSARRWVDLLPLREIPPHDQSLEWRQVQARVKAGRIPLSDLIDVGRGWEQVSDCTELEQEVDQALERARRRHRMLTAGLILANVLWPLLFLFAVAVMFRMAPAP